MSFIRNLFRRLKWRYSQRHNARYQKMSVPEIFSSIYKENTWGGEKGTFYSGTGTADPNTAIYMEKLLRFINERRITSIVEVGCGDFSIMNQVMAGTKGVSYLGLDVVADLIDHHNKTYGSSNIRFELRNAIDDPLPPADLLIIRQVLQHLDNASIAKILPKVQAYPYALITEHLPVTPDVQYNLDKVTGPNIRMKWRSGVFIDQPPFSMPDTSVLFEYRADDPVKKMMVPAVMRTYLYVKQ